MQRVGRKGEWEGGSDRDGRVSEGRRDRDGRWRGKREWGTEGRKSLKGEAEWGRDRLGSKEGKGSG